MAAIVGRTYYELYMNRTHFPVFSIRQTHFIQHETNNNACISPVHSSKVFKIFLKLNRTIIGFTVSGYRMPGKSDIDCVYYNNMYTRGNKSPLWN